MTELINNLSQYLLVGVEICGLLLLGIALIVLISTLANGIIALFFDRNNKD